VNGFSNKEGPIKHIVEVNIYYQDHKERMEIGMIRGQKWSVILEILWLTCYNLEIDWRTGKMKMMRYTEERGKQRRLKQGKLGRKKQKKKKKKRKK